MKKKRILKQDNSKKIVSLKKSGDDSIAYSQSIQEEWKFEKLIDHLFCLVLFVSPLVYFPYIENFSNLPKTLVIQTVFCVIGMMWLIQSSGRKKFEIICHPIWMWIGLWILWSGITIVWAIDRFSALAIWIHWSLCYLGFWVFLQSGPSLKKIDKMIQFSLMSAGIVSLIGIFQYLFGIDVIPQSFVPGATFSNKNIAAEFVVMIWPLSVMMFFSARALRQGLFFLILSSLMTVFLLYAKTRAIWVAMLVNLLIFSYVAIKTGIGKEIQAKMSSPKIYCFFCSIVIVIIMANLPPFSGQSLNKDHLAFQPQFVNTALARDLNSGDTNTGETIPKKSAPKDDFENQPSLKKGYRDLIRSIFQFDKGSVNFRMTAWANTLQMHLDHMWGTGLGNWYVFYPNYHNSWGPDPFFSLERQPQNLHNEPLQILSETSIVGLICFLGIFVMVFRVCLRIFKPEVSADIKIRTLFLSMAVGCFWVNSLFSFPLRTSIPPLYFMMVLAIMVFLDRQIQSTQGIFTIQFRKRVFFPALGCLVCLSAFLFVLNLKMIVSDFHFLHSKYANIHKNWEAAVVEGQNSIQANPWRHKPWFELAAASNHLGFMEQAITGYQGALNIHPNHINSLIGLSKAYFETNHLEDAASTLQSAIRILPDSDQSHYNLGLIHEKLLRFQSAIQNYRDTLALNKANIDARYRLAMVLMREGQIGESKKQFEELIRIKPDHAQALHYLEIINSSLKN